MATMQACIFHGPGDVRVGELPVPVAGPGEVVVRMASTALCASDIRVYRGEKHAAPGVVQGHELAGTVEDLGASVTETALGERVAVYPVVACGECFFCALGKRNRCLRRVTLGYDLNGGLAEFVLVPAQSVRMGHVVRLPDAVPFPIGAMAEPVACTLNSLETCQVRAGTSLAVLGAGPMGLIHIVLARALGVGKVIVSEPVAARREAAAALGATIVLDPTREDVAAVVKAETGGLGADAVAITIGHVPAIEEGIKLARRQGIVNIFAGSPPEARLSLDPNFLHYNEIFLTGTQNATYDHFRRTVQLLPQLTDLRRLITHTFPLADAPKAFDVRLNLDGLKAEVVPG